MKKISFQNFESSILNHCDLFPISGGSDPASTKSHGNTTNSTGGDSDNQTGDSDTDFY